MKRFVMPRSFAVLALPFLLFSLAAAQKAPDLAAENLVGPVRSVSSTMTEHSADDLKGRTQQQDLVTYDPQGNESGRTIYDDYGFLAGRQVNKRDPNGQLIESILSDDKGRLMERQVYVYTEGKLAETVHYDAKGKVGLREVTRYDDKDRPAQVTYYEGEKAVAKTVYRYDGEGLGSEAAFYLADGSKAEATIGPCLGAHRMTYAYDGKARPSQVVAYEPSGKMKKTWLYAYNDRGLMAEEKREDDWSNTTSVYAWEYDERGNWTKAIITVNQQPKHRDTDLAGDLGFGPDETAPPERTTIISRKIGYY
jgi:hypothetical protein